MGYTLKQLAEQVGATIIGNGDCEISRVASIENAGQGDISFVYSTRFVKYLETTQASAAIVTAELADKARVPVLVVDNPRATYARITSILYPVYQPQPGVHFSAVIDDGARISDSAYIGANAVIEAGAVIEGGAYVGPGCVIGRDSVIGPGVYLHANVTVYYGCFIGENSIIHSGSTIGADGFGFERDQGEWVK
ncbi:MAG: UDP-3-O-(3-hydroxymyristoyl)glucosamine N-acyltransferase, partial [Gammaproteobacteria bacterium]|nr:UDP-3-O-(3-hydroxymyristoyl)glucosamine N-acyltransferase [Gammaproteobacteria bacterium]